MSKASVELKCKKCGVTFCHTKVLPSKEVAKYEEWAKDNIDYCPACASETKKHKDLNNILKGAELPAFTEGTEKQIAWAEKIRDSAIIRMNKSRIIKDITPYMTVFNHLTNAKWWIDNRDNLCIPGNDRKIFNDIYVKIKNSTSEEGIAAAEKTEEEKENATISCGEVKYTGSVEVIVEEKKVKAVYEKNDAFKEIVKSLGFSFDWSSMAWEKKISEFTGSALERAGELIAKLVSDGFRVSCQNNEAKSIAINGEYLPENPYWIKARLASGDLAIEMHKRNDDLYQKARKITNSKWDRDTQSLVVSISHYAEVMDFAEMYGFGVSAAAKTLISEEINKENNNITVAVKQRETEQAANDPLKEILKCGYDVVEDLKDDTDTGNSSVWSYDFTTELKDYQKAGVEKLKHLTVGALFMEQGTGKTRTALELIKLRFNEYKTNSVLWLCPCSITENLRLDIIKHCGVFPQEIKIRGIESLSASVRENIECINHCMDSKTYLIVDESLLVKNPTALRTKNIIKLSELCKYKLILNGTPISKTEADLFSQFFILDKRILGYNSYWSFAANHLETDETGRVVRCLNKEHLVKKIEPYSYQVKKEDVLTLPNKKYQNIYFDLTLDQEFEYIRVLDMFLSDVNEFKPETLYRLFTALQLVLSGNKIVSKLREPIKNVPMFENPEDNPRVKAAMKVIEDYASNGEKCVIFCKYSDEIDALNDIINKRYGDGTAVKFYGETGLKQRNKAIEQFKGDALFLIANKTCAGFGLNLQFCNHILFYSNDWDYATRVQAEDRCHRMGQTKNVIITDITADNKLDDKILNCLYRKENLLDCFKDVLKDNDLRSWFGATERLNDKMIRVGFDINQKNDLINAYLKQNKDINKVYVFYYKRTKHEFDIKTDVDVEYIEFDDTEMYVYFYRLLKEIDDNKLIIVDEVMRSTAKNRKQLKYNCMHHYLNQTTHRLIFEYYPIVENAEDFMILLDFYDDSYKQRKFDYEYLKTEDIKCVPRRLKLKVSEVPITIDQEKAYKKRKEELFENLGKKKPETVPSALQLLAGDYKKSCVFDNNVYIARNKRFRMKNVVSYSEVKEPQTTEQEYIFIDTLMNRLHFNDFLKNTRTSVINYLSTGLSIDNIIIDDIKRIEEEKEKIYAQTSIY